jgi:hypothetical protein
MVIANYPVRMRISRCSPSQGAVSTRSDGVDAANVPNSVREEYFQQFNDYLQTLE